MEKWKIGFDEPKNVLSAILQLVRRCEAMIRSSSSEIRSSDGRRGARFGRRFPSWGKVGLARKWVTDESDALSTARKAELLRQMGQTSKRDRY